MTLVSSECQQFRVTATRSSQRAANETLKPHRAPEAGGTPAHVPALIGCEPPTNAFFFLLVSARRAGGSKLGHNLQTSFNNNGNSLAARPRQSLSSAGSQGATRGLGCDAMRGGCEGGRGGVRGGGRFEGLKCGRVPLFCGRAIRREAPPPLLLSTGRGGDSLGIIEV